MVRKMLKLYIYNSDNQKILTGNVISIEHFYGLEKCAVIRLFKIHHYKQQQPDTGFPQEGGVSQ